MLILDFETRSRVDLKVAGTANYVCDPSTEIICCAFYNQETLHKQLWYAGDPLPEVIRYALVHADLVVAHNAEFDKGIYEYIAVEDHGFPRLADNIWYCSSAQCRVNAIPAGLDDAAWALGLTTRKFAEGKDLIKKLSIPQADGLFNYDPNLILQMGEYCMNDVIVTDAILNHTRQMTQNEHLDWLRNTQINERGIKVDRQLATLALRYAKAEQTEIGAELAALTGGAIKKHTENMKIKKWIIYKLSEEHMIMEHMTVYKKGVKKITLDKNVRRNILLAYDSEKLDLPDDIVDVIQLLDDGNKSSVAKFKRMIERADSEDDRVRGALVFAGASQTLRYASRGLQVHNMRRECWDAESTARVKQDMMSGRAITPVMDTLSKLLRPALIPEEGNVFVVGDWSSIEAMCLPYLADTEEADAKLDMFEAGEDVYQHAADQVNTEDRQVGKTAELACGFGGGYRAFQGMARNFGLSLTDYRAQEVVSIWRANNQWCVEFWYELERAAKAAICLPGTKFQAGAVEYVYTRDLIDGTLICILPGDHFIQYPKARIEKITAPWGDQINSVTALKAAYKPKYEDAEWPRTSLYGGLFAENVTQAFAAALLRNALRKLDDVVIDIHDEIVLEVPEHDAEDKATMLRSVMLDIPEWAAGLPLAMEPFIMTRYGKG